MTTSRLQKLSKILPKRQAGMTLVEIMIVLTIIGAIMAFAAYSFVGMGKAAKIKEAEAEVEHLSEMVNMYTLMNNELPDQLDDLAVDNGRGEVMDHVPDDPWGNPYEFSRGNDGSFTLFSAGPNGSSHDDDDIYPEGMER